MVERAATILALRFHLWVADSQATDSSLLGSMQSNMAVYGCMLALDAAVDDSLYDSHCL